jgi:hypothetical protein
MPLLAPQRSRADRVLEEALLRSLPASRWGGFGNAPSMILRLRPCRGGVVVWSILSCAPRGLACSCCCCCRCPGCCCCGCCLCCCHWFRHAALLRPRGLQLCGHAPIRSLRPRASGQPLPVAVQPLALAKNRPVRARALPVPFCLGPPAKQALRLTCMPLLQPFVMVCASAARRG